MGQTNIQRINKSPPRLMPDEWPNLNLDQKIFDRAKGFYSQETPIFSHAPSPFGNSSFSQASTWSSEEWNRSSGGERLKGSHSDSPSKCVVLGSVFLSGTALFGLGLALGGADEDANPVAKGIAGVGVLAGFGFGVFFWKECILH